MERTKEMCTPRPRCVPAHVRQMKVENLGEAFVMSSVGSALSMGSRGGGRDGGASRF